MMQAEAPEMAKVIAAAAKLTGDLSKALIWCSNEPIADYDRKTAAELVAEGQVDAVLSCLRDLENGARG